MFNTSTEKVLEVFMKKPTKGLQIRQVIRETKLGNPTVMRVLKKLMKKNLLKKMPGRIYPYYEANIEDFAFKKLKIMNTTIALEPLITVINKTSHPNCIVLFGSAAKGEDTEQSDIDLFIQAKRKYFDTTKIEKNLVRKINLIFESDVKKINKELRNNLANGIILSGYFEVIP